MIADNSGSATGLLAVIGGGVIGLTCALAAADAGWRVRVFDAGAEHRAAWVAAGMLGSLGEGHPGEDELLALSTESVRRWPQLLSRLGGHSVLAAADSLFVAASSADAEHLDTLADFVWARRPRAQDDLRRVGPTEIRRLESAVSSRLHSGYLAIGEGAVDNRRLLAALREALLAAGGEVIERRISDLAELADAVTRRLVDAGTKTVATGIADAALSAPIHDALTQHKIDLYDWRRESESRTPSGSTSRASNTPGVKDSG